MEHDDEQMELDLLGWGTTAELQQWFRVGAEGFNEGEKLRSVRGSKLRVS